jgi:hypothetical protein
MPSPTKPAAEVREAINEQRATDHGQIGDFAMCDESGPPPDGDNLDAELARVHEAYLADLEAGRPVDAEKLLAEHPALANQLRSCLDVVNLADRVADRSGSAARVRTTPRSGIATSPPGGSALTTLGLGAEGSSQVHLRDLPDECEPIVWTRSDGMPALSESGFGRYQLQGEIARGGMGAVIEGRDIDLGRDLAIKVLLESHRGNSEVVRRFVEEAQIGGQLQHPGIVPVYELGAFPDRRPYFAMKLVKGRTLAALLAERTSGRMKEEGGRMKAEGGQPGSSLTLHPSSLSDSSFILHPSRRTSIASSPSSNKSGRRWPTRMPAA